MLGRYCLWLLCFWVAIQAQTLEEETVYAVTLDGNLYSIAKRIGHINWNFKLDPITTISIDPTFLSDLFPNPKDGTIYVNLANSTDVKLLPYTIPELVNISPIMNKDGLMFIGDKKDEWLIFDDVHGILMQKLSSSNVWKVCPSIILPGDSQSYHATTGKTITDESNPFQTLYLAKSEYNLKAYNTSSQSYAWNVTYTSYKIQNRYTQTNDNPLESKTVDSQSQSITDSSLIPLADIKPPLYPFFNETYYADCHRGMLLTLNSSTSSVKWSIELTAPVIAMFGNHQGSHANHPSPSVDDLPFLNQNMAPLNLITVRFKDFIARPKPAGGGNNADKCHPPPPKDYAWHWGPNVMAAVYLGQYNETTNDDKSTVKTAIPPNGQSMCYNYTYKYALPSLLSGTLSRRITHKVQEPPATLCLDSTCYPRITGAITNESDPPVIATKSTDSSTSKTYDKLMYVLEKMGLNKASNQNVSQPTSNNSSFNTLSQADSIPSDGINRSEAKDHHHHPPNSGKAGRAFANLSMVGKFFPYPIEVISAGDIFVQGPLWTPFASLLTQKHLNDHALLQLEFGRPSTPPNALMPSSPVVAVDYVAIPFMFHPILYNNKWYDMLQNSTKSKVSHVSNDPNLTFKLCLKGLTLLLSAVLPFILVFKNTCFFPRMGTYVVKWIFRMPLSQRDGYSYRSSIKVGKISLDPRNVLGVGSLGTIVYRGRFEGRDVAVKRVLREHGKMAEREIRALIHSDRHDHVIRYHCAERGGPFVYIALELCQTTFGACADSRVWNHVTAVTSPLTLCAQMLTGLAHLHSLRIVHRDLKPQNVLVSLPSGSGRVRAVLSDFGISKNLSTTTDPPTTSSADTTRTVPGTLGWKPREVLFRSRPPGSDANHVTHSTPPLPPFERDAIDHLKAFGSSAGDKNSLLDDTFPALDDDQTHPLDYDQFKADVFSSGCVVYYVISGGQHPFGSDICQRQANILNNRFDLPFLKHDKSDDINLRHLLTQMLSTDPLMRPSASSCAQHPFFWSPDKKLQYFMDLSDLMEKADSKERAVKCLEKGAPFVVKHDWKAHIDHELQAELRKYRSYRGDSLRDLLRAMRNKKHHYQELPTTLKEALGAIPDDFLHYFTSRFPYLLIHLYMVGQTTLANDHATLKKYFPPHD